MSPLVFVVFSTIFGVSGQLMLKRGMNHTRSGQSIFVYMATSPWVIGGVIVYGLGVLNWLMALSRLELSYVYPFASLSYVGIIIGSYFLFKENMSRMRILGICIIIAGVLITSQS